MSVLCVETCKHFEKKMSTPVDSKVAVLNFKLGYDIHCHTNEAKLIVNWWSTREENEQIEKSERFIYVEMKTNHEVMIKIKRPSYSTTINSKWF